MGRALSLDEPGMIKICSWPAFYKDGLTQVPYVRKLATDRLSSKEAAFSKLSRLQSRDTAQLVQEFIDSNSVKVGHTYFLDTALGAYEAWGPNNNGDAFLERDLLDCGDEDNYGYRSFRKHAHVYRGHRNHDPALSIGKVVLAAYNAQMRRVELIEEVDNVKAADLLDKWDIEGSLGTSMGTKVPYDTCVPAGARISTPDGMFPVETIEVGSEVFTAQGNVRAVTELFRRRFTGTMATLDVRGLPVATVFTGNHPVLVVRKSSARGCFGTVNLGVQRRHSYVDGICGTCGGSIKDLVPEFVPAETVAVGDYVVVPRIKREASSDAIDPGMAKLCGYYLGDGSLIWRREGRDRAGPRKAIGIAISCHADEKEHIEKIKFLIEGMSDKNVHVYPAGSGRNAVQVMIEDRVLAAQLLNLCGQTKDKHIPREIFSACAEAKLEMVAGLIDTDGHVNKSKGDIRYISTLPSLALGIQLLLVSLGIPVSMSRRRSTSTWSRAGSDVYQVCLGGLASEALAPYSVKCATYAKPRRWSTALMTDDAMLIAVTGVLHEAVADVEVFNFSVAEDETYLVSNMAVHNCSICHNNAKTAAVYCEHAKYAMGTVYDDGRRVYVSNPRPRFFDQSHVMIPADKIAGAMMKVAQAHGLDADRDLPRMIPSAVIGELFMREEAIDKAAHEKTASERPIEIHDGGELDWTPVQKTAQEISEHEAQFPLELLEDLAARPLTKVASTLTAMGIVPSPREWQFLFLEAAGRSKLAHDLHAGNACFDPVAYVDVELSEVDRDLVAVGHFDADLGMKLAAWLPLRSADPMWMAPRVAVHQGGYPRVNGQEALIEGVDVFTTAWDKVAKDVVRPEQIRKADPSLAETMLALAVSYGIIRAAQGQQSKLLDGLRETTGTNPAVAAALLAAGAAAALGLANHVLTPGEKRAAWMGGPKGGFWEWIKATPEPIHSWVLPFAAGYMSSAWYRAKQIQGEPTSAMQNVVADHPLAAGIAATTGVQALKKLLRAARA